MKKKLVFLFIGMLTIVALAACGQKTKEDVIEDLNKQVSQMKSYKSNAKMTLKMGTGEQAYDIEIWHKKPHFYRVNLKNAEKEQSQMIIRNDDDVFVLTPALNKSFRFQSDWPKNSSQAYLFESLVADIVDDKDAKFTATKEHYIFETKTRYQNNKMLPIQEIKLSKKNLAPISVKVMDTDRKELVTVTFSETKFDVKFEKKDFDLKKNMTSARIEIPAMAELEDEDFSIMYPTAEIPGVVLKGESEMKSENGLRVILTYEGADKSFTLIQEKAQSIKTISDVATSQLVKGEPVDLGFTIGAMTENSIMWTHQGVDFLIASNELTKEEMLMVATSIEENAVVK